MYIVMIMMLAIPANVTPAQVANIQRLIAGGKINVIIMIVILMLVVLALLLFVMIMMFVLTILVIVKMAVFLLRKTGILLINVMTSIVTLPLVYKRPPFLVMITMSALLIPVTHTGDVKTQI
jgi:hypothetical protein